MSTRVALLGVWTPQRVKRWGLERLFAVVATAFGVPVPEPETGRLAQFAAFTRGQAERALRGGNRDAQRLLYSGALTLGRELRRRAGAGSVRARLRLARIAYRSIGVDFREEAGRFVIDRCYFAQCCPAPVCALMSALDRGLIAGISGGRPIFHERVSGCECCRGWLETTR